MKRGEARRGEARRGSPYVAPASSPLTSRAHAAAAMTRAWVVRQKLVLPLQEKALRAVERGTRRDPHRPRHEQNVEQLMMRAKKRARASAVIAPPPRLPAPAPPFLFDHPAVTKPLLGGQEVPGAGTTPSIPPPCLLASTTARSRSHYVSWTRHHTPRVGGPWRPLLSLASPLPLLSFGSNIPLPTYPPPYPPPSHHVQPHGRSQWHRPLRRPTRSWN